MSKFEKIKIFLLGMVVAVGFMLLLGTAQCSRRGPGKGHYQIATVVTQYVAGVYVLDTTTGIVSEIPVHPAEHRFYYPEKFQAYRVYVPKSDNK